MSMNIKNQGFRYKYIFKISWNFSRKGWQQRQPENGYKRYRKCTSCPHRFLTVEKVAESEDYKTWIEVRDKISSDSLFNAEMSCRRSMLTNVGKGK